MAKSSNPAPTPKPTPSKFTSEKVHNALNKQLLTGETENGITIRDAFDLMENVEDDQLDELTAAYFEFEDEGTYHFIFNGMTKMKVDDKTKPGFSKEIDCVQLQDKEAKRYINGNAVLVTSLARVNQVPCLVRVKYNGDKEGKNGTYKDLQVMTFPMRK